MTTLGIDYAWIHPDPSAIAQAGYRFAVRYLSNDPRKNLTLTEARGLARYSIPVVANWEFGAMDMLRGYKGGVDDARQALAQATAAGMPGGRPIYFSADWDVTPEQENTIISYLTGARDALGADPVGLYGGFYPVRTALDLGAAKWAWQTSAWSGGQWDGRDKMRQVGSAYVGGVQVDIDAAEADDFGQWFPVDPSAVTATPPPLTETDEMVPFLIAVTPDPSNPANTGAGVYLVTDRGVAHVCTEPDLPPLETKYGARIPQSTAQYDEYLRVFGPAVPVPVPVPAAA